MRFNVIRPYLTAGAVGAELGVFKGAFIDYLLSTKPQKLYAVDPWYRLSAEWPWAVGDKSTVKALTDILTEYRTEIAGRLLEPRVEYSTEFLAGLTDDSLDWVYIDSSHAYEPTLAELTLCERKVKPSGFIIGDDYNEDPTSKHYGVCKAVKEHVAANRLSLLVQGEGMQFVTRRSL